MLLSDEEATASPEWWSYVDSLGLGADWRAKIGTFAGKSGRKWVLEQGVAQMMVALLPWVANVWVKNGNKGEYQPSWVRHALADPLGVLHLRIGTRTRNDPNTITSPLQSGESLILTHYPPDIIQPEQIISTTGAGDSFVGGLAAGIVAGNGTISDEGVRQAIGSATRSLASTRAVGCFTPPRVAV